MSWQEYRGETGNPSRARKRRFRPLTTDIPTGDSALFQQQKEVPPIIPEKILFCTDFSENWAVAGDCAAEYSNGNLKVGLAGLGTAGPGSASMLSLGAGFRRDLDVTFGTITVLEGCGSDSTATQEAVKCW
jgi:hypothetical protein